MYLITQIVVQIIETTYDTFVPKDSITVLYYHNMGDKQVQHKLVRKLLSEGVTILIIGTSARIHVSPQQEIAILAPKC
jgi:hypothetical protein